MVREKVERVRTVGWTGRKQKDLRMEGRTETWTERRANGFVDVDSLEHSDERTEGLTNKVASS